MKLEQAQIGAALQDLSDWTQNGDAISRTWKFADFGDAMVFVNRVAELAQLANHHPDIDIRYSEVKLSLSSHDAGGLTRRDFKLAKQIDEI
jgi:4a-hydroxytetrahydrobiopterin dehydratase